MAEQSGRRTQNSPSLGRRSALVTGGTSGIGEAVARLLVADDVAVVVTGRQTEKGVAVAREIGAVFAPVDYESADDVRRAVATATELAPLRYVVASAAIPWEEPTIDAAGKPHSRASFERVMRVNVVGTFEVIRTAAEAMAAQPLISGDERGAMVLLSSIEAHEGRAGEVAYAASKAALVGMTLPLARDLAAIGIRVCTVSPGFTNTPIFGAGQIAEQYKDRLAEEVVFPRRFATPDEVASLILECLTNTYMNGSVVRIDGATRMPARLPERRH